MTTFMQGQGVEEDKLGGDVHMPAATLMAPPSPGAPVMAPGAALLAQRPPAPPVELSKQRLHSSFRSRRWHVVSRRRCCFAVQTPCSACPRG